MANSTGQASIEFLVILGISVVIITSIIILSSSSIGDIGRMKEQNDVRNSIADVSSAAREVYTQGAGAKKQVYIYLPSSYEPGASYVANKSLKIRVGGSDYASLEDFDVHGSWPGASGGQWVWVISEGNKVRVGTAMLSLSRNSVYMRMDKSMSNGISYTVQNIWGKNISVTSVPTWTSSDVALSVSQGSFTLSPGQSAAVSLTFTTNGNAVGYHYGEIAYTATEGNNSEVVRLPITVEVSGTPGDTAPPLNVTPDIWALTMQPTNTTSKVFTVCTNSNTAPTSVTFTPSAGAPGSWVSGTTPLGAMGSSTCQVKSMSLTVPNGTVEGTYSGTIDVVGQGVVGAQDSISVFVVVLQNGTGNNTCSTFGNETSACNCPVGSDYWGVPLCNCQPATIYVMNGTVVGGPDNGLPFNGTLRGGSGASIIAGTDNADIIFTGQSGDRACGNGGNDAMYGGVGPDIMDGGDGDDTMYGDQGGDLLYGKEGDDTMYGGQGDDQIDGGEGNDILYGDDQDDLIYAGPGVDTVQGGNGKDRLCGNSENDNLQGGGGNDDIDGGSGSNTIDGGANADNCYRGPTFTTCESTPGGSFATCGPS